MTERKSRREQSVTRSTVEQKRPIIRIVSNTRGPGEGFVVKRPINGRGVEGHIAGFYVSH